MAQETTSNNPGATCKFDDIVELETTTDEKPNIEDEEDIVVACWKLRDANLMKNKAFVVAQTNWQTQTDALQ